MQDSDSDSAATVCREARFGLEVSGGTVGEALDALTMQYPDLRRHLFTDEGRLRSFVNVYVGDEDIRYLNRDATAVKDTDTISMVPV